MGDKPDASEKEENWLERDMKKDGIMQNTIDTIDINEMLQPLKYDEFSDLITSFGCLPVDKKCIADLVSSIPTSTHFSSVHWLQQKQSDHECLTVRDLAVFALLYNQSLLVMHNETNEALSFDMQRSLQHVQALRDKHILQQKAEIENFENELAALILDDKTKHV